MHRNRLLLVLFAFMLGAHAWAADISPFNGHWDVEYVDAELGRIAGKALVDVDAQAVVVTYVHPETEQPFKLVSKRFEVDGNTLRVLLKGRSPTATVNDGLGYPVTSLIVPEDFRVVSATLHQSEAAIAIAPRAPSDIETVNLELNIADSGMLIGEWSYSADPFTRRARDGRGRVGIVDQQPDDTIRQVGSEVWLRPEPKIVTAFAINSQIAWNPDLQEPHRPYPFQDDQYAQESVERFIAIAGYDLPDLDTDPVTLTSLNPAIRFGRLIDRNSSFKFIGGHLDPFAVAQERVAAENAFMGTEGARRYAESLDYLFVTATVRASATNAEGNEVVTVPGLQRFVLNDTISGWHLGFGNNGVRIRFVREVDPAALLDRRFDRFDFVIRKPDNSLSRRSLTIEVNDLIETGLVAPSSAQWVRSGDSLGGDLWTAATDASLDLDKVIRDRADAAVGAAELEDALEAAIEKRVQTLTPDGEVVNAGVYRGAHGTIRIEESGHFEYQADPRRWSSPGYEPTPYLFTPESFRVALRTDVRLPVDQMDVVIGTRNALLDIDGNRRVIAAVRDPDDPRLYLTAPLFLPTPGGDTVAQTPAGAQGVASAFDAGDTLFAMIATPGLISVPPEPASAQIFLTPARMEFIQSHLTPDSVGMRRSYLWKEHLRTAHGCYDDLDPIDWDRSDYDFVATIEEDLHFEWWKLASPISLLFSSETLETSFQLGDHAALLLLRQTFEAGLEPRLREYRRLAARADREEVAAFWIGMNPFRRHGAGSRHPLNRIEYEIMVPMPNGAEDDFLFTYDYPLSTVKRVAEFSDPGEVPDWIVAATRSALSQYADAIEESLATARDVEACDVSKLVMLVGDHFDSVVDDLIPRMMTLSDDVLLEWKPDYAGRLRVSQVASKLWQVRAHQRLSEEDTEHVLFYGSLITLPLGGLGAAASIAMAVLNGASYVYFEYPKYAESRDDLAFARGASETLGFGRFAAAKSREYRVEDFYGGLAISVLGDAIGQSPARMLGEARAEIKKAIDSVVRLASGISRENAVKAVQRASAGLRHFAARRGERMINADDFDLERVIFGGNVRNSNDLGEFLAFVLAREAAGERLEPGQLRALSKLRLLQSANPAEAFTGELRALADIANRRPDLVRLIANSGDEIAAILGAGGRRRDEALAYLRYFPQDDFGHFEDAVTARLALIREPLGKPFFDIANPENRLVVDLLGQNGWDISVIQNAETGAYNVTMALGERFSDKMILYFDAATQTIRFKGAARKQIPGRFSFDLPASFGGKRVPTLLLGQMRFLHSVGIGYAGEAGSTIRRVKLDWVLNARTNAQLAWYRRTHHPDLSFEQLQAEGHLSELLQHTRAVEFSRTFVTMAGYRVTSVEAEFFGPGGLMGSLKKNFSSSAGAEDWEDFLRRYGLNARSPTPPDMHIYLNIEPHPRASLGNPALAETAIFELEMPAPASTVRLTRPGAAKPPSTGQTAGGSEPMAVMDSAHRPDIRTMANFGISRQTAARYAAQIVERPIPADANAELVRGQVIAEAIMEHGDRPISFEEFARNLKLEERGARWAAKRAARRLQMVYIPGEIRPRQLLPPEFR